MSKVPVSVCIIAKNEEKFIEDCLKHLLPYGMEVIVADTGCRQDEGDCGEIC